MRNQFDRQLSRLNSELIEMGALCEEAISDSVKYLIERKPEMKKSVHEVEDLINSKERDIESLCMKLLIKQQPVASDFREITSALKMISDMERIGDQAEDIVDVAWFIKNVDADSKVIIKEMAKTAVTMVTNSVESYVKKSLDITEDVVATDDKMDELFSNAKKQVIYAIKSNSDDAETLVDLLMVAKYFERIGDHAENIVEWVQYAITGEHKSKR